MPYRLTCKRCGKGFTSPKPSTVYCSWACRKNQVTKTCKQCGAEFTRRASESGDFCSKSCATRHRGGRPVDPDKKATVVCPGCGNLFSFYKSWPQEYCSRECRKAHIDAKRTAVCPTCGKEFTYDRSWPRKYCSNKCAGVGTVRNIKRWEPSAFVTTCEECGTEFATTPKATRGRFCSLTCLHARRARTRVALTCAHCGQAYTKPASGADGSRFCSKECKTAWHVARSVQVVCEYCGLELVVPPNQADKRFCSANCHDRWRSENVVGENHPDWKGGRHPYYGPLWPAARRAAYERDGGVCQDCGITDQQHGKKLVIHHVTPFRIFGLQRHAEANNLRNLLALCDPCHRKAHRRLNRAERQARASGLRGHQPRPRRRRSASASSRRAWSS